MISFNHLRFVLVVSPSSCLASHLLIVCPQILVWLSNVHNLFLLYNNRAESLLLLYPFLELCHFPLVFFICIPSAEDLALPDLLVNQMILSNIVDDLVNLLLILARNLSVLFIHFANPSRWWVYEHLCKELLWRACLVLHITHVLLECR